MIFTRTWTKRVLTKKEAPRMTLDVLWADETHKKRSYLMTKTVSMGEQVKLKLSNLKNFLVVNGTSMYSKDETKGKL